MTFSIGNSSAIDNTIKAACPLGNLLDTITGLTCDETALLDNVLGTSGNGLAQTHNTFEGDSSFLQPDWETINGLDASTIYTPAFQQLWTKRLADGTFGSSQIFLDWASYRKNYAIGTNPCYLRVPIATIFVSLGAYTFPAGIFANFTPAYPVSGTLAGSTLASFSSVAVDQQGNITPKGLGKEQIPHN